MNIPANTFSQTSRKLSTTRSVNSGKVRVFNILLLHHDLEQSRPGPPRHFCLPRKTVSVFCPICREALTASEDKNEPLGSLGTSTDPRGYLEHQANRRRGFSQCQTPHFLRNKCDPWGAPAAVLDLNARSPWLEVEMSWRRFFLLPLRVC